MTHDQIKLQIGQLALRTLAMDEEVVVRAHLEEGCEECEQILNEYEQLTGLLAEQLPPLVPPPELKSRVMGITSATQESSQHDELIRKAMVGEAVDPNQILRSTEGEWEQIFPGISRRILAHDMARKSTTMLLKMDANSVLPPHIHYGVEEVFILEGSGRQGGISYSVGDYIRVEAGSVHPAARTNSGCLMLVILPEIEFLDQASPL